MTQEDVDRIENEKFIKQQREAAATGSVTVTAATVHPDTKTEVKVTTPVEPPDETGTDPSANAPDETGTDPSANAPD